MGMSFNTALAASFQGQELVAKLEGQKAETANNNAQAAFRQQETAALTQKAEGEKQMAAWISSNMGAETQPGATAEDFAQKYTQGARVMAGQGNFQGMKQMQEMAKTEVDRAKGLRVEQEAAQAQKVERSAQAAIQYVQNPTPENAVALAGTATQAGINPVTIPQPGTMEFMAFAKNQQTASLKAKENLDFIQRGQEFDSKQEERQANHADSVALRQQALAQQAAFQNGTLALRGESLELRKMLARIAGDKVDEKQETAKDKAAFQQSTKLVDQAQKEAKPYFSDRSMTQAVKGLLAEGGSPAQDKQIQQYLTSLKTGVGRATNLYYKDNKNFGDFAQKIEGFASGAFTGRYSEEQRKQIFEMVDGMERKVIDPALRNLENDAKEKAKLYKLNPEPVKLAGEFNRTIAPKEGTTAKGGASVTGAVAEPTESLKPTPTATPAVKPAATPPAGAAPTIRNPKTGETMTLQNGQWVKQ